jgi:hypothetical protein
MNTGVRILVAAFKDEASADQAYRQLNLGENDPWLADAAIVVHQGNKVKFKESKDMGFVDENLVTQATDALKHLGASVTTEGLDADTVNRLKAAAGTAGTE